MHLLYRIALLLLLLTASALRGESYVQFEFRVPPVNLDPFARELVAEVKLPDGNVVRLPAFYLGDHRYALRVHAGAVGDYSVQQISDFGSNRPMRLTPVFLGSRTKKVSVPNPRPFVRLDRSDRTRFRTDTGQVYTPIGMNVAWPTTREMSYYRKVFPAMGQQGLNWSRVWMSHWGRLNLDWLEPDLGPSPRPGTIDSRIAANWDEVIQTAEESGVYLQVVLQHHGQYSSSVNSNWEINPWNAALPEGFLKTPAEFFTSEKARRLTRLKYRYIVARWGYSPAILSWELFNEVHYTDAMSTPAGEKAVAAWHHEMADYLRSLDVQRHLVTTSVNPATSPIYAEMDYRQPHLYAPNMLAAARSSEFSDTVASRPAFLGELGDEQMVLTTDQQTSGVAMIPPVWASLAGRATHPGQIWYGYRIMDTSRLPELGAVAGFLRLTRWGEREGLNPVDIAVRSNDTAPLVIRSGSWWLKQSEPSILIPRDGREPAEYAAIPRALVGNAESRKAGYPARVQFTVYYPEAAVMKLAIGDAGPKGAQLSVWVDSRLALQHTWPPRTRSSAPETNPTLEPAELTLEIAKGEHTIVIENTGGNDAIVLNEINFGLPTPRLAAIGKRSERFFFAWIWNRTGVFAVENSQPAKATLSLENVPAGTWTLTWWDSLQGAVLETRQIEHAGGEMAVDTPLIARHAAMALEKR